MWGIGLVGYIVHCYANFFSIPESRRKKSERVLVFSELGISRAATAAIAYLIKGKQWSLKVRIVQTNQCRGFCASRVTLAGCEQWGRVFLICHSCAGVLWACEAVQTPHQATASIHGAAVQLGNPSPRQNPHKPHPPTALTHALHTLALTLQHILSKFRCLKACSWCPIVHNTLINHATHTNTHRAAFQSECVYMGVMHDCAIWWIVVVVRWIHPISSTAHKIRHTYQYTQTKQKKAHRRTYVEPYDMRVQEQWMPLPTAATKWTLIISVVVVRL